MAILNVSAVDLRPKKSFKSPIWQYFGFKTDKDDNAKPTCKLCFKKVSAAGGNTSNLQRHLHDHHPAKAQELGKQGQGPSKPKGQQPPTQGQSSISEAFSKMQKYERGGKQWQKLTNLDTHCLAKDMMPLYTVEKSGFKQLLNYFDLQHELPSRKYFGEKAKLCNETKDGILQQLQHAEFFSVTSDKCLSNTMEAYMSYTIHFVADEQILDEWQLSPSNQVCLTTDS